MKKGLGGLVIQGRFQFIIVIRFLGLSVGLARSPFVIRVIVFIVFVVCIPVWPAVGCLPVGAGVDLTSGEGAPFLFPSAVHAMAGLLLFFFSFLSFRSFLSFFSLLSFLRDVASVVSSSESDEPGVVLRSDLGSLFFSGSGWGWVTRTFDA